MQNGCGTVPEPLGGGPQEREGGWGRKRKGLRINSQRLLNILCTPSTSNLTCRFLPQFGEMGITFLILYHVVQFLRAKALKSTVGFKSRLCSSESSVNLGKLINLLDLHFLIYK